MPPLPPVTARAIRHATSFASEPELTNITTSSAPPVDGDQPLRDLERGLVQVAHVRVQAPRLADDRLDDPRMPVADDRDVVVGVEIAAAVGVDQPDAVATHQVQRLAIGEARHGGADRARAPLAPAPGTVQPAPGSRPPSRRADLVPADRLRAVAKDRDALAAQLGHERVGVVVQRGARGRDDDRGAHPRGEELAEDRPLPGLERRDLLVAVDRQACGAEELVAVATGSTTVSRTATRSTTSADQLASPKSMIPVTCPSSSTRTFEAHRSVWMTCARRLGQTGVTTLLVPVERRVDQLADLADRRRRRASAADGARAGRPRASRGRRTGARSRAAPARRARPSSPSREPPRRSRLAPLTDARPGSRSYIRTWCVPSARRVAARYAAGSPARAASRDEPRKRDREVRVDLGDALGGERLQVEPRRVLGRVRDLQDGRPRRRR